MAYHVHIHLGSARRDDDRRRDDAGTPEGARKAAQTRREHPEAHKAYFGRDGTFGRTFRGGTEEEIEGETKDARRRLRRR